MLYPLLPGHPAAFSSGLPLTTTWLGVLLVFGGFLIALGRPSRFWLPFTVVLALLCLLKLAAATVAPQPGLVARYYTFDEGRPLPNPERSTDFLWLRDATRVDRELSLNGETFPLFFFNNNTRWNAYKPSDTPHEELPFLVTWDGWVRVDQPGEYTFKLSSEGPASIRVDRRDVVATGGDRGGARDEDKAATTLAAGFVPIQVQYERLEHAGRRLEVQWEGPGVHETLGPPNLFVTPPSALSQSLDAPARLLGQTSDALYALVLLGGLAILLGMHARAALAGHRGVRAVFPLLERPLLVLLVLFAFYQAEQLTDPVAGRMVYLAGGEDPLTRETQAREITFNGPLMAFDSPFGKGKPYYSQVLYPYLVAGIHRVVGEPLSGVYLVQVTLLGVLVVLTYLLAKRLFGAPVGLVCVALFGYLVWTEYVPVAMTLFAEDFYDPLIVGALLALVVALREPSRWRLLTASAVLTLAALTRFTGMAFVPIAALVFWVEFRHRGWPPRRALGALALLGSVLAVALILVSGRNLVVASTLNFVPASLGNNLIKLHKPSDDVNLDATRSPLYESLKVDPSIRKVVEYARQDFGSYAESVAEQALYAVGYTGSVMKDQPYHPWFLGGTLLYLLGIVLSGRARTRPALLLHGFILSHWLLMGLFFASQYRYRLILPMYPFIYVFASFAIWRVAELVARPVAALVFQRGGGGQAPVLHGTGSTAPRSPLPRRGEGQGEGATPLTTTTPTRGGRPSA